MQVITATEAVAALRDAQFERIAEIAQDLVRLTPDQDQNTRLELQRGRDLLNITGTSDAADNAAAGIPPNQTQRPSMPLAFTTQSALPSGCR